MKDVIKKWETILSQDEMRDITYGRNVLMEMLSDFKQLYKPVVMQGLLSKCPHCHGTGLNPEIPNYDNPPNSSPTVGNSVAGQSGSDGCTHYQLVYIGPWYSCSDCGTHFHVTGAEAPPEGALPF